MLAFIASPTTRRRAELGTTFAKAALAYWLTVFPRVCLHVAHWRRLARRIPDPELRRLAIAALEDKRANIEGAAAFAAFAPRSHRREVTRAVCALQAAYNLLDMLGEQPSADPVADGRRLHEALTYALDIAAAPADWYALHPHREDGGYLDELLHEARGAFARLPSYELAAPAARVAAARIVAFQSLNLSESQGDHAGLESWALQATPPGSGLQWWETAAAAGSSLGVYVLIAAAARADLDEREVRALERAYFPWIGGLHSLLDNLIDKHEDEAAGHRSLIEYYGPQGTAERLRWLAQRAAHMAAELPYSERHMVVLAGMMGNYLSTPQAHSAQLLPITQAVLDTAGALAKPTLLVFKLRRLGRRHRG